MSESHFLPIHALDAAFALPNAVASLGRALWLFVTLVRHAGYGGTVIRTQDRLIEELGITENDLTAWLERLSTAGLIRVQSPLPYLVCRIRSWPGSKGESRVSASNAMAFPERRIEKSNSNAGNTLSGSKAMVGKGGVGERDLRELAREVLGPDIEAELPAILARHPEDRIRRAIDRVQNTPREKIRKSRVALFRYLVSRPTHHP
ncbi:MAG: hypothetical protein KDB18_01615 [Salinibacterium sp.]|nr:hypothetical protein [Salinibacterium sp.]